MLSTRIKKADPKKVLNIKFGLPSSLICNQSSKQCGIEAEIESDRLNPAGIRQKKEKDPSKFAGFDTKESE